MRYTFVAAFVVVAGYGIYVNQKVNTVSDLMLANVEALADSESNTSWTCDGWWGDCSAYCGVCTTKVEGDGSLKGTHTCSGVSH